AGVSLQELVDGLLDSRRFAEPGARGGYAAFRGRLRHDLRTPLNAVTGYCEMLLEDAHAAHAEVFVRDLGKMLAAAKRLLGRIDSLLDLARVDAAADAGAETRLLDG